MSQFSDFPRGRTQRNGAFNYANEALKLVPWRAASYRLCEEVLTLTPWKLLLLERLAPISRRRRTASSTAASKDPAIVHNRSHSTQYGTIQTSCSSLGTREYSRQTAFWPFQDDSFLHKFNKRIWVYLFGFIIQVISRKLKVCGKIFLRDDLGHPKYFWISMLRDIQLYYIFGAWITTEDTILRKKVSKVL